MNNILLVNCTSNTYIESAHPSRNTFNDIHLYIGSKNRNHKNIFVTLAKFNNINISPSEINSAYLYLYIEELNIPNGSFKSILICNNYSNFDIETVSWNTPPKISPENKSIHANIPHSNINNYIKIDITPIFKSWYTSQKNYGLTIGSTTNNDNSLIRIASIYSNNPPYIKVNTSYNKNSINELSQKVETLSNTIDCLTKEINSINEKLNNITIDTLK